MSEVFRYMHRVTYSECTVGNHIYHSRYLDLAEAARGEFLRSVGISLLELQQQDTIFPVIEAHLKYKAPARYDDLLTIQVAIIEMKGVRLNVSFTISNQNNVTLVTGETWHVCTTLTDKPKRLPPDFVERLQPYFIKPVAPAS